MTPIIEALFDSADMDDFSERLPALQAAELQRQAKIKHDTDQYEYEIMAIREFGLIDVEAAIVALKFAPHPLTYRDLGRVCADPAYGPAYELKGEAIMERLSFHLPQKVKLKQTTVDRVVVRDDGSYAISQLTGFYLEQ